MSREAFITTFESLELVYEYRKFLYSEEQPIAKEFEAALKDHLPNKPRPKKYATDSAWFLSLHSFEAFDALIAPYQKRIHDGIREVDQQASELKKQLELIAAGIDVKLGELDLVLESVYIGTYRSQGWGAESYAKNTADLEALKAKYYGVPTEVLRENDMYRVHVKVLEPIDLEILRYKPHVEFKEQIRFCLRNGINPKVYCPFLPYEFEKKLGMDYYGNDLPGVKED